MAVDANGGTLLRRVGAWHSGHTESTPWGCVPWGAHDLHPVRADTCMVVFVSQPHMTTQKHPSFTYQHALDGVVFVGTGEHQVVAAIPFVFQNPHPALGIVGQLSRLVVAMLPVQLMGVGVDNDVFVFDEGTNGQVEVVGGGPPVVVGKTADLLGGGMVSVHKCGNDSTHIYAAHVL